MQWEAGAPNAGFSSASKTYAPVVNSPDHGSHRVNVLDATRDPSSLFHIIRRMIAVRRYELFASFFFFFSVSTAHSHAV